MVLTERFHIKSSFESFESSSKIYKGESDSPLIMSTDFEIELFTCYEIVGLQWCLFVDVTGKKGF